MPANWRREARRMAGFRTQADLAERLGWHKSTVSNIECGLRKPPDWYDWLVDLAVFHRIKTESENLIQRPLKSPKDIDMEHAQALPYARYEPLEHPYLGIFHIHGRPAYRLDHQGKVDRYIEDPVSPHWTPLHPQAAICCSIRAEYRARMRTNVAPPPKKDEKPMRADPSNTHG